MKKLLLIFAAALLTANVFAQTVDYTLPQNWMCHPVLKSTDAARQQTLKLIVQHRDLTQEPDIIYPVYTDTLVDIFYVYPTIDTTLTFAGNSEIKDIDTITAKLVYREQVGIYQKSKVPDFIIYRES